jgi:hypothetical protein
MPLPVAPLPTDLSDVASLKAYITPAAASADDPLFQQLVSGVSLELADLASEGHGRRRFNAQTYTEARDGRGRERLILFNRPLVSVTSVSIDGQLTPQAVGPLGGGWLLEDAELGIIALRWRGTFPLGVSRVSVVYTAGYNTPGMYALGQTAAGADDLPFGWRNAALIWAGHMYEVRNHVGESRLALGGGSVAYTSTDVPSDVRRWLAASKAVAPIYL